MHSHCHTNIEYLPWKCLKFSVNNNWSLHALYKICTEFSTNILKWIVFFSKTNNIDEFELKKYMTWSKSHDVKSQYIRFFALILSDGQHTKKLYLSYINYYSVVTMVNNLNNNISKYLKQIIKTEIILFL